MYISDFNYHKPATIDEACRILSESPDGAPLAGGTDILVEMKQGLRHHLDIVSLMNIAALKTIELREGELFIGAGATHNQVAHSTLIKKDFPAIAEAASAIGTEQIRNTGTIGGNLCTGASCCDMAPILMALDARVVIRSANESRTVPLSDFFVSHKETRIRKGEIMTTVIIPAEAIGTGASFEKFGLREAASISVASTAAAVKQKNDVCSSACVVIGAVAATPKICTRANHILTGKKISELTGNASILEEVSAAAVADAVPIDDLRGSAEYRRHLIRTLTRRALRNALARLNPPAGS